MFDELIAETEESLDTNFSCRQPMLFPRARPDLDTLQYPLAILPKIDGVRAQTSAAGAFSRTLRMSPNRMVNSLASRLPGMDTEMVCGGESDPETFNRSTIMWRTAAAEGDANFLVFDCTSGGLDVPFLDRYLHAMRLPKPAGFRMVPLEIVRSPSQVESCYADFLKAGFEGAILRDLDGRYKPGRATMLEGLGYKLKQFEDAEAVVTGVVELMTNTNGESVDPTGAAFRSTNREGLVPAGVMGSMVVHTEEWGSFNIGSGFTAAQRLEFWTKPPIGRVLTFKYMPHGTADKPRHPIFKGWRDYE